jgi:CRISPR system Cascade subunit CasC
MLQNFAPANLNRDDTGSPKDAIFGGALRGRISSQCLKHSIRKSATFAEAFGGEGNLGMRTKLLPKLIDEELGKLGIESWERMTIVGRIMEIGRKAAKAEEGESQEEGEGDAEGASVGETKQLIFIGRDEIPALVEKARTLYQELGDKQFAKLKIADLEKALKHNLPRSVDIAMFGRMTTSEAFEDVQAAVQVAHAISTNKLVQEFDYYTAVDDLSGQSGAGMIGDVEFNSSTYYKYVNIHWEGLVENLGGIEMVARKAVLALIEAAATAQPSGKQNTFAAHNLPDLVLVEVQKKNLPVSYANAFLKPARASGDETLMDASVRMLGEYMERIVPVYSLEARRAFAATSDYKLVGAERVKSLTSLKQWLEGELKG